MSIVSSHDRNKLRILILGGYGTFGGRLAQLLCVEHRVELCIAGRSAEKAHAFCRALPGVAQRTSVRFDRDGDIDKQLSNARPAIVVDASGPFQAYGDSPYRVVEGCLRHGSHYLDLADGAAFVRGISRYDEEAKGRQLFVLSGVSSFPVLTAAVVRSLIPKMTSLDAICGGIAPSPYAGVGLNVIRAIASYAGRRIDVRRDARNVAAYPFTEARPFTIAPPGKLPLRRLAFSLVDVPDLEALADLWPDVACVWIGAAPQPAVLHAALRALAWLVRLRVVPTLAPFAPLMHWASNVLRWGEHRGGMFVEVRGRDERGEATTRSWHLLAEGDDGPLIPSMAAEAVIRKVLDGSAPTAGARAATRELEIGDYERMFERRAIRFGTRTRSQSDRTMTLYRRVLGAAWNELCEPIRNMHDVRGDRTASGRAEIERGRSPLAALIGAVFGFPRAGTDVPLEVRFEERDGKQRWTRRFGRRSFSSIHEEGTGAYEGLLCERFGPFVFGLALVADAGRLRLVARRWSCFGVPLPLVLCPRGDSYEFEEKGRFGFHVEISHPLVGLIIQYRGWLAGAAQ